MNREETKKALEVMQAYVDGAEIECRGLNCRWLAASSPAWKGPYEFRVKPKPPTLTVFMATPNWPQVMWEQLEQLETNKTHTFVLKEDL